VILLSIKSHPVTNSYAVIDAISARTKRHTSMEPAHKIVLFQKNTERNGEQTSATILAFTAGAYTGTEVAKLIVSIH
jgi:uncharacterized protein involved in copper resistance